MRSFVASFLGIAIVLCSIPSLADRLSGERVEVICPSNPEVDAYSPITIVARNQDWTVNSASTGHVWLWTDGPWFRPFHVEFRPSDQGVIVMPGRFGAPVLQRVEAYTLGGTEHTWSNPALPVPAASDGPRLLWGTVGDAEPGADFILAERPAANAETDAKSWAPPVKAVASIPIITRQFRKETWYLAVNPGLAPAERDSLAAEIAGADGNSKLLAVLGAHAADVLLLRHRPDPNDVVPVSDYLLMVDPGDAEWARAVDRSVTGVVAGPGGLIAVWSMGPDPARIWRALKQGAVYGAWGSRIIIDLAPRAGSSNGFHALIAGQGPRETVSISRIKSGKTEPVFARETDSDHLEFDFTDPKPGQSPRYLIHVLEPNSPRHGQAVWASAAGMP